MIGLTPCRILKFYTLSIALSTSVLKLAIFLVSSTSLLLNRLYFNGGIISLMPLGGVRSEIKKPLSAIIESPRSHSSKIPLALVSCLSLKLPAQRSDTNVIIPDGLMPRRAL